MKIAFTIGTLSGGGAERVVARLANQLNRNGHKVSIFLIANNKVEYTVDDNVKVSYVEPSIKVRGLRYFSRINKYKKLIKGFDPDVVISFTAIVNIFVISALRHTQYKVIVSERNNPYVDPVNAKTRRKRDKLYESVDGIVFQTEDAKKYFNSKIQDKSIIIANPIDENLPKAYEGDRENRIVTIGRLEPQKNQKLLIDAFAKVVNKHSEFHLDIYGEGSLRGELCEYISSLGLTDKIFLKGYCKNVLTDIIKSTAFVLSSDYEGMSNALIEAMAIGLPVISTDHPIGGARELIVDGENGLLVSVGDADLLSNAMLQVIDNKDFAYKLTTEAIKVREKLSVTNITKRWESYCKKIVE